MIALLMLSGGSIHADIPDRLKMLEKNARDQLNRQILILRHFYSCPEVTFSADGLLVGEATTGPWTLYGFVQVKQVEFDESQIRLRCQRIFNQFDQNSCAFKRLLSKQEILLRIQRESGDEAGRFERALDRIFLKPSEDLSDVVPDYWRLFLLGIDPSGYTPEDKATRLFPTSENNGNTPDQVNPHFTPEARAAGITGELKVLVRVDPDGSPHVAKILKPLGYGLDDSAAEAVRHWKFQPVLREGQPVTGWHTATVKYTISMDGR